MSLTTKWCGRHDVVERVTLPISQGMVLVANKFWGNGVDALWADILSLADDMWGSLAGAPDDTERAWKMLVFAIGNFKRPGARGIRPLPPTSRLVSQNPGPRRSLLVIQFPGGSLSLDQNDQTTMSLITSGSSRGLSSPPTGSTLLSALWPGDHVIIDVRDLRAPVGLLVSQGHDVVDCFSSEDFSKIDWGEYQWFRLLVRQEATRLSVLPVQLERALFFAAKFSPTWKGQTWLQYGTQILETWRFLSFVDAFTNGHSEDNPVKEITRWSKGSAQLLVDWANSNLTIAGTLASV
jgi:hypothetical protein